MVQQFQNAGLYQLIYLNNFSKNIRQYICKLNFLISPGLFVDYVHRKLYFSNMDMVTIDGTAFTWHRIEMIGLDQGVRRVIITDVESPRGIYVDMQNK